MPKYDIPPITNHSERKREPRANQPRVITVRISHELHEALRREAYERRMSLNHLCATVLRDALVAEETTPEEQPGAVG